MQDQSTCHYIRFYQFSILARKEENYIGENETELSTSETKYDLNALTNEQSRSEPYLLDIQLNGVPERWS